MTKTTKTTIPDGLKVTGYYVLVKLNKVKETTAGGIILPDLLKDAEAMNISVGQVVGIGEHAFRNKDTGEYFAKQGPWCSVGDWVICPKFGTKRITFKGDAYSILHDDEIMGVVADPADLKAYI